MLTLKQAWLFLLKKIIENPETEEIEDYKELCNESISFSLGDRIFELKEIESINTDYIEMRKVFFSGADNIFGHSYKTAIRGPISGESNYIDSIIQVLKNNPTSRRAVLTFMPYGDSKIPCISSVQFLIRQNKINIIYNSRGQDIYRKFPCDVMCIAEIGHVVADKLKLPYGEIHANIASAHIYDLDLHKAKSLVMYTKENCILTSNKEKYKSFVNYLSNNNIELIIKKIDLPEIQDIDYINVSKAKAKAAYEAIGFPVWIDDTTLLTEAIPNFPGPYTKDLFKILNQENLQCLFEKKSKNANLICTLCSYDGREYSIVQGSIKGYLDFNKKIENIKMPLDSLFVTEDKMGHRRVALMNLVKFLNGKQK